MSSSATVYMGITLNNASDYRTNGLYRTPNPNPNPHPNPNLGPSPLAR